MPEMTDATPAIDPELITAGRLLQEKGLVAPDRTKASLAEVRAAVNEIAATAQRLISIYTPDLEPDLYDQSAFLEVIKHFVLTRSFAKVRVLLAEPTRVMRDSNRFVAMGRRLSSCIDIRYVAAQAPQRASAYLIADDRAIVYAIIQLAHALGITVVAEGVEAREQLDILEEFDCDFAQGYLIGVPQPASEALSLSRRR